MKKDFNIEKEDGLLNIEIRTDGGIEIYLEAVTGTLMLDKRELTSMAKWMVEWLSEHEAKA